MQVTGASGLVAPVVEAPAGTRPVSRCTVVDARSDSSSELGSEPMKKRSTTGVAAVKEEGALGGPVGVPSVERWFCCCISAAPKMQAASAKAFSFC